ERLPPERPVAGEVRRGENAAVAPRGGLDGGGDRPRGERPPPPPRRGRRTRPPRGRGGGGAPPPPRRPPPPARAPPPAGGGERAGGFSWCGIRSGRWRPTTKPSPGRRRAGSTSRAQGSLPSFRWSSQRPADEPGTPAASGPTIEASGIGLPWESRYMSRRAAA